MTTPPDPMSARGQVNEEVCPTPEYHATHYYCPSCTWVAEDAPVSEAEAQRARADALHAQLAGTLASLALEREVHLADNAEWAATTQRLRTALRRIADGGGDASSCRVANEALEAR